MQELLDMIDQLDFNDRQMFLFALGLPNFFWWVDGEERPKLGD